jgi:assimilatory nitrate reductase catalytic subunit
MHWSDAFAKAARVDALVAPITDPISGQPESKHTPVRVDPYRPVWQGFVLSRDRLALPGADYCARSQGDGYWRQEIAGELAPEDWRAWVRSAQADGGEWMEFHDAAMGRFRAACVRDGRLESVFFIAADHGLPQREWLASLFRQTTLSAAELAGILSARPPQGTAADSGRIVCACFSVGEKTILNAVESRKLDSVEAVGQCLKAGTGCGSCVPEIRRLLDRR